MLPVADQPLLAHTLDAAAAGGASRFVVVVGYRGDDVVEAVGDEYAGIPVEYVEQSDQRGTADAVRHARQRLGDGPFVVLNGDSLYDHASISRLYATDAAVASYRSPEPEQYGVLRTAAGGSRVTGVVEKPADPPSNRINAGAYTFPPEAQSWLDVPASERDEYELTDVLERVCREYEVTPVSVDRWLDIGRPWELLAANGWKLGGTTRRVAGQVSDEAVLDGHVAVEPGAEVRSGVTIEGPALVRSDATVGPNAYVRGTTLIGPDATVGHGVEVKNSVLCAGATVGHLSYVGDSVLGRGVNFGAGTVVANLRHDEEPVEMTVSGERVSSGRRKLGVAVGDGAKTGINTGLNAGVKLSPGAETGVGEAVTRDR
jgi:bifunctional UDP-N-acetylglucosamine pyrophosphorylase/glucosamine-1-phosphate N-acetyltransferase